MANFFLVSQGVNILDFAGCYVSFAPAEFCHEEAAHRQYVNEWAWLCSNKMTGGSACPQRGLCMDTNGAILVIAKNWK